MFNRLVKILLVLALIPLLGFLFRILYENGIYFGTFLRKMLLFLYFS